MKQQQTISTALKGAAMGMAEVIPGVSGGTIAFITGIYETLLNSIKAFGPVGLNAFRQNGFKGLWETINGNFLVALISGMAIGVVSGIFGITHLLETYPILLWAFFFGLIIASAIYIGKQVNTWDIIEIVLMLAGAALAYYITVATPAEGSRALWFVFLSGAIAISALLLPGISGSFILLLMGMYTFIIPLIKEVLKTFDMDGLVIVGVFALGCLTGLVVFSRILSWTFKHYRNQTLALLTGFMIGSLNKIWPWRQAVLGLDESGQQIAITPDNLSVIDKVLKEINLSPSEYGNVVGEPFLIGAIVCSLLGFAIVFLLERLGGEH